MRIRFILSVSKRRLFYTYVSISQVSRASWLKYFHFVEKREVTPRCRTTSGGVEAVLDTSGNIVVYGTKVESKRGVLSQLVEKTRSKDDRKESPGREECRDRNPTRRSRKSPENVKHKLLPSLSSTTKISSFYRPLRGSDVGGISDPAIEILGRQSAEHREQQSTNNGI